MEAEHSLSTGGSRGGYIKQLELVNAAAEKVHFYRQLLLHVDDQLNRARLALGAYRRGEVGPGQKHSSSQNRRSSRLSGSSRTGEKKAEKEDEEKIQLCDLEPADGLCSEEYYLFGTTFLRADSVVLCTFLSKRIQQLEARRDRYRHERKAAIAALLQLSPAITDLAEAEWGLLLAEPEVKRWKEEAETREAARQQLINDNRSEYLQQ